MAQSSRHALRAVRSLQRCNGTSSQLRSFTSKPFRYAAAPVTSVSQSNKSPSKVEMPTSTSTAAATENALKSEPIPAPDDEAVNWAKSFHGLSAQPFPKEAADILMAPIPQTHIEIKPDGIIYLPEIHYRRILNRAFGPGGWGLAPRGETIVTDKAVTREYALVALGRLVSVARGEQDYFSKDGIPTASEGCKSNAMMRCCKDLGVASELWDPRFIREWKSKHAREAFVENVNTKKRTKIWLRKGDPVNYPFKETPAGGAKQ